MVREVSAKKEVVFRCSTEEIVEPFAINALTLVSEEPVILSPKSRHTFS